MKTVTKTENYQFEVEIKPDRVVLELTDSSKYKDRRSIFREEFEYRKILGIKVKRKFDCQEFQDFCMQQKAEMIKIYEESLAIYRKLAEPKDGLTRMVKRKQSDETSDFTIIS